MDTIVLDFFATLFLATSIEAIIVSVLVYFNKVNLDIDFEQEVKMLYLGLFQITKINSK